MNSKELNKTNKKHEDNAVILSRNFNPDIWLNDFYYEGTMEEWKQKNLEGTPFEAIPCIKCSDGSIVQKL